MLARRLAHALAKLVLIDAPAGYGKTTLVAQWRGSAAEDRPFAWVSLDPDDNDPVSLWSHVVHALHRARPELCVQPMLEALRAWPSDIGGSMLPILVSELNALPGPVALVLDDYHRVKERSCHGQVDYLLCHLPPAVQLVLTTRADPPLPLARLRSTGDMVELRMSELRFTPAEAGALISRTAGIRLADHDLAELVGRTEGWPAGVYLAALSLRAHPSPGNFVRQFSGNSRYVADLLVEEVLGRQPAHIRDFLARTSILGEFSAPLCDAVLDSADAAEIIGTLERENLFVVPVGEDRGWYRYHRLFAQLLRSQLTRAELGIIPALHRRASAWHRQEGSPQEAIGHALAGGDADGAVDLIAGLWVAYAGAGRAETIRTWLQALGEDVVAAHPVAAHCAAWVAALAGDRPSVARWLPVIEAADHPGPLPDGMHSLRSSAALLRGVHGFEGLRVMQQSARLAAELEKDPASPWYALARVGFGFSLHLWGEPAAAAAALEEAVVCESPLLLIRMMALSALGLVAAGQGRLLWAEELVRAAGELAGRDDLGETPQVAVAHLAAGALLAAQGKLHEARAELEHALRLRRRVPGISPWPTLETLLLLAEVLLELGDHGAADLLAEAQELLTSLPDGADVQLARVRRLRQGLAGLSHAALLEPLTEREATVLRLLRGTLSLREIGQELHLSPNTVKTHTRVIYRKLGVSSRGQAVEQGRQAGIC
ncbi:MAG TPA: LuxR C-terminal-related transcriptional regulator [Streptosporangiaceae bacterium]|jgi:LuxR family maltose regulon positive regulatory protein|nr:LuxR C-terminal-related transcriptional regulator [Streptosporangiaceae bacterium]